MAAESDNTPSAYEAEEYTDGGSKDRGNWEQGFRKEIGLDLELWNGNLETEWYGIVRAVEDAEDVPAAVACYYAKVAEGVHGPVDSYLTTAPEVRDEQQKLLFLAANVLDYAGTVAANVDERGEYDGADSVLGGFVGAVDGLADLAHQLDDEFGEECEE